MYEPTGVLFLRLFALEGQGVRQVWAMGRNSGRCSSAFCSRSVWRIMVPVGHQATEAEEEELGTADKNLAQKLVRFIAVEHAQDAPRRGVQELE